MTDRQPPDETLVRRAKKGDTTAFDVLVERHYRHIFSLAFQMLGNADDAADATQDTFVKAFGQLKSFRGDSAFATWLYRIAVNTCRDVLRRPRSVNFSQLADNELTDFDPAILTEPNPDEVLAQRERAELVHFALQQLPDEMQQVLVLCDMQGLSYTEAAAVLGVPNGTLKSRLHRARQAFKNIWLQLDREQTLPSKRPKDSDK